MKIVLKRKPVKSMVVDYQKSKVYKIVSNSTDLVYVGSTTQPLYNRIAGHRRQYKKYQNGADNYVTSYEMLKYGDCEIVLLEDCPCDRKEQLYARERYFIETLACVNKVIPGRKQAEYREANKEKIIERGKQYYEVNKEKIIERGKQYYEVNKEKIIERGKQYREANKEKYTESHSCPCGGRYTTGNKNRHTKSKKHTKYLHSLPPPAYET